VFSEAEERSIAVHVRLRVRADAVAEGGHVLAEAARGLARAERTGQEKAAEEGKKLFHRKLFWPAAGAAVENRSLSGAGQSVADGGHILPDAPDRVAGGQAGENDHRSGE
jgi:hypothetical protein